MSIIDWRQAKEAVKRQEQWEKYHPREYKEYLKFIEPLYDKLLQGTITLTEFCATNMYWRATHHYMET